MKRSADSQLTRENAEREEDAADAPGMFQRASERDLAKRVIRPLPKRRAGSASVSPGPETPNPTANGSSTTNASVPASSSTFKTSLAPLPPLPTLSSAPSGGFSFNLPSASTFTSSTSTPGLPSAFGSVGTTGTATGTAPKPAAASTNGAASGTKFGFGSTPPSLPSFSFGTSSTTTALPPFGTFSKDATSSSLPPFKPGIASTNDSATTTLPAFPFTKSDKSVVNPPTSESKKSNARPSFGDSKGTGPPPKFQSVFAGSGATTADKSGSSGTSSAFKPTNKSGTFGLGSAFSELSPASPNPPEPSSVSASAPPFSAKGGTKGSSFGTKATVSDTNEVEEEAGLDERDFEEISRGKPYDAAEHSTDPEHDAESRYLMHLRGLNLSFFRELTKAQKKDPFVDLSPLFQSYGQFRRDTIKEFKIAQGEAVEEERVEEEKGAVDEDEVLEGGEEEDVQLVSGDQDMLQQDDEAGEESDEIVEVEAPRAKTPPAAVKPPSLPFAPPAPPSSGFSFGGKMVSFGAGTTTASTPFSMGSTAPAVGGFVPKFGSGTSSTTPSIFPSSVPIAPAAPSKVALPGFAVQAFGGSTLSEPTSAFGSALTSHLSGPSKPIETTLPSPKPAGKEGPAIGPTAVKSSAFAGGNTSAFGAPTIPTFGMTAAAKPAENAQPTRVSPSTSPFNASAFSPPVPTPVFGASFSSHVTTGPNLSTFAFPPRPQSSPDKTPVRSKEPESEDSVRIEDNDEEGEDGELVPSAPRDLPAAQPPISNSRFGIANPWAKPASGIAPPPAVDSPFKFGMGAKPAAAAAAPEPTKATAPSAPSAFSFTAPPTSTSSTGFSFAAPPSSSSGFSFADPPKATTTSTFNPFSSPPKIGASFALAAGLSGSGSGPTAASSSAPTFGTTTTTPLFGGGSGGSFSFGGPLVTGGGGGGSSTLSKGFSFTSTSSTDSIKGGVGSSQETVVVPTTTTAAAGSTAGVSQDSDVAPEGGTGLALGEDKFDQPGPGEENEESLFNVRGKVMKFSGTSWADLGIGQIRIYKHKETGAKRIFARNSKSGRILLNFAPFAKMEPKIDDQKANFMRMTGMEEGRLMKILIKLKEAREASDLVAALQKEISLLS